jgi:hypothetical protein
MLSRHIRVTAGIVALAYIAIQMFQEYVYRTLPVPTTAVEELLAGADPLHVTRSALMLFGIAGATFVYIAIPLHRLRARPVAAGVAIAAFGVWAIFELGLRSVELFWTQLQLPAAYAATHDAGIVEQLTTFASVQGALYVPLMGASLVGSVAILLVARRAGDRLIVAVFAFNSLRIVVRMLSAYAGVPLLPAEVYDQLYLGIVVIVHGPLAYWLLRVSDASPIPEAAHYPRG